MLGGMTDQPPKQPQDSVPPALTYGLYFSVKTPITRMVDLTQEAFFELGSDEADARATARQILEHPGVTTGVFYTLQKKEVLR